VSALSLRERVARERRVREARPTITILQTNEIVGRVALIRRCRATFSQWEKDWSRFSKIIWDSSGHRPPLQAGQRQLAAVNVLQRFQFSDCNVLVDFMNGSVGGAEFKNFLADLRDEAAVTRATGG
jgi:hypothetical protein